MTIPRRITSDRAEAAHSCSSIGPGPRGIMAKATAAPYEAGAGFTWLKVKPAHTLDLVVLAAEWARTARGKLSNIHLARAIRPPGYVMLGRPSRE